MSLCMGGDTRRAVGSAPRITRPEGSLVNQMLNLSAFSETMLIHEHACVAIDPDMPLDRAAVIGRSEEHTSELQSLMRISYAVFCLKNKKTRARAYSAYGGPGTVATIRENR